MSPQIPQLGFGASLKMEELAWLPWALDGINFVPIQSTLSVPEGRE